MIYHATHDSGGRQPAAKQDIEDEQHRAARKQLSAIVARYGTSHVLGMLADAVAPPDSATRPSARTER